MSVVAEDIKNDYRKKVQRLLDDPIGREILGEKLNLRINHSEDLKEQAIVAVLVPSNRGLHPNMLDARSRLLRYSAQFCTIYAEPIKGSSVVSWVRNDLVSSLYAEGKKFTHVLFLDDDMVFDQDVLVRMLRHDKDVVGALYTYRTDPPVPTIHLMDVNTTEARKFLSFEQEGLGREGSLIFAERPNETLTCGTGVMLIKREVLDRTGQMYLDMEYEQKLYGLSKEQMFEIPGFQKISEDRKRISKLTGNRYWFQFLPRLTGYGESGEDTSFCLKAALCGFKVYVDTEIQPLHMGEYGYSYKDFLPYQAEEISKAKAKKQF